MRTHTDPVSRSIGESEKDRKKTPFFLGLRYLMVFLSCFIFFGCGDRSSKEDSELIKAKLEQIEDRLSRFEEMSQKVPLIESQIRNLQKSVKAIEISLLKKTAAPTRQNTPPFNQQKRYYEVRQGDSLARIARRNGITLDEICRLNGITAKAVIRPGQQLIVSSER